MAIGQSDPISGSPPPRLLITGSRDWPESRRQIIAEALRDARRNLGNETVLVHGAATGADSIAAWIWAKWKLAVEAHPAEWEKHGKSAGPIRNQHMVSLGANLCLAFPLPHSRGTWDCVRRAQKANIPVLVFSVDERKV